MIRIKGFKNNKNKNKNKKNEKQKNFERKKVIIIKCRANLRSQQATRKRTHQFQNQREIKTIRETTQRNEKCSK